MIRRSVDFVRLAAMLLLAAGCFIVFKPFLTATLLAAVVCISTWPLYLWLLQKLKGRRNIAALAMTLSLALLVILPLALVAWNLADNISALYLEIRQIMANGPAEPPAWLKQTPVIGKSVADYWHLLATSPEEVVALENRLLVPARNYLLAGGMLLGQGVMEMSLAAFVCFFLFREGTELLAFLDRAIARMVGNRAENVLAIINNTVRGVMYGLLGTALAQGIVATIGFSIAGVPAALALGVAVAMFSLVPVGPPLVWGCAAAWLFYQGEIGWGIFMLLWGFFLISTVDDIVKPLLISHSSKLPFVLIVFGVLGGLLAFGFVGIFIGPTLLAVAFGLIKEWVARDTLARK